MFTSDSGPPGSVKYNAKFIQQTMITSGNTPWVLYACGGTPSFFNSQERPYNLKPTLIGIAPRNTSFDVSYHSMPIFN